MADNSSIDPGTTPSVVIAADDIAGVKYQRVKISVGDDGTAADVGASNALPVSVAGLPASLGQKTSANSMGVVIASDQSAIPVSGSISVTGTMPVINTDLTATGSVTSATSLASITTLNGASTVTVQITSAGTTCTVTYEATVDGSTWTALNGLAVNGTGAFVSTSTTTGVWQFDTAGFSGFRARVSTYTSGTVTGFVRASVADASFGLDLPLPTGTNTIGALSANQSVSVTSGQQVDGHSANIGLLADASSASTLTGLLKNIKAALAGTLTVTGAVTNAGTFAVQYTQPSASTGAPASFTATTTTTILSANANAKLRTFANDSDKDLYLMLRAAAASIAGGGYTVKVPASGGFFSTDYTGEVRGLMSAAIGSGQVNVGEFT